VKSELFYRVITSVLFIPVLIFVAYTGGIYYLLFIELGIALGAYEFYKILEKRGLKPFIFIGVLAALTLGWASFYASHLYTLLTLTALLMFVSISELYRRNMDRAIYHISGTMFGVLYVGWLFSHLILLRQIPVLLYHHEAFHNIHNLKFYMFNPRGSIFADAYSLGAVYTLIPFVLAWSNDITAYFVGNKFGKHKILKRVSPGKSWEGCISGGLMGIISMFLVRAFLAPWLNVLDCLILGGGSAFLSPMGDLVESLLKRDVRIKDASSTIPGHGGFLDRFDSVLFVAPLVYYYLTLFVVGR